MGANCCCGKRQAQVGDGDLNAKLLKDDRTTMASMVDVHEPINRSKSSFRSPSISESSYDKRAEQPIRAADSKLQDEDDDPFASPRHFVDENELSFKSGTSNEHDRLSYSSSTSSLRDSNSYTDTSSRFKYSSKNFDAPSSQHGWDM
ncbi:unnamed protein product [Aphanomyces euteiches]|uniref:Uncharacterized protein n=1 Tax=Aphanomyces euteiches TaxID=100861 RepID=A0A6G0WPJ3_9STRA|nr:hypothetical protein Ae201684_013071 [Aphanomyces euteiches]KAH9076915.1 hypothetical protein Ae201684P_010845 [Aphanomyces euteiches]KAH9140385.1 hypothetical protein AeRB84_015376 [Aphanomyces euteiches]KAH9142191.1 hypothetical protein AeRB84_013716 [Aphanomyces euteiches]KAH9148310.1 hypothetical protein AeRB84_008301 [Aphanomyces euteiches]